MAMKRDREEARLRQISGRNKTEMETKWDRKTV